MNTTNTHQKKISLSISALIFLLSSIIMLVFIENQAGQMLIVAIISMLIALFILMFPPIGVALVIVSTPLADLLPDIPLITSVIPLLGLVTLAAYLLNKSYSSNINSKLTQVEILALIFFLWVFISNPAASLLGQGRTWALTFMQLWVLLWLASHFVHSQADHHLIMIIIALGIIISGIVALVQSGGELSMFRRAAGLGGGANTSARYFVYGIILLLYLQDHYAHKRLLRLWLLAGIGVLIAGLIFSGSRSGAVLFFIIVLFQVLQSFKIKARSFMILLVLSAGLSGYLSLVEGSILEIDAIFSSLVEGSDTVGIRYDLVESGWGMFLDHPISGVGIGNFRTYLPQYWPFTSQFRSLSPHNTYIQVLSETGIIGLVLFISMVFAGVRHGWKRFFSQRALSSKTWSLNIDWAWFFVLIILLIGALTKTDLTDKFFWFLLGVNSKRSR